MLPSKARKPVSLVIAVSSSIACILFSIALARYVARLPDDWVGMALYSAAIVAFAINAIGYGIVYIREGTANRNTGS